MNEPPIASPFGAPVSPSPRLRPSTPLLLKILVGVELGQGLIRVIAAVLWTFSSPSLYGKHLLSETMGNTLVGLIYAGLLRGSKWSWWLVQLFSVFGFYKTVQAFMPHHARVHQTFPRVFPVPISWLLLAVAWTLFIYLLTPAMRQFFFSRPKTK